MNRRPQDVISRETHPHSPTSSQNPQSPSSAPPAVTTPTLYSPEQVIQPTPLSPKCDIHLGPSISVAPQAYSSQALFTSQTLPISQFDQLGLYSPATSVPLSTSSLAASVHLPPASFSLPTWSDAGAGPSTSTPISQPSSSRTPSVTFQVQTTHPDELHPDLRQFHQLVSLSDEPANGTFVFNDPEMSLSPSVTPSTSTYPVVPPATKEMSFLECVVETMKGCEVLKRLNFISATDAVMWLARDMCDVRYKLKRKAGPTELHSFTLNDVQSLILCDSVMHIETKFENKPLCFIFPTPLKAEIWLCGLRCLIPKSTIVKSKSARISLKEAYNALHDCWNGEPLHLRKRISEFVLLETIGRGSFGKVKLAFNSEDSRFYAIKVIPKNQLRPLTSGLSIGRARQVQLIRAQDIKEVQILSGLCHPNITRLEGVFDDQPQQKFHLVLEFVPCGPILRTHSKNITSINATSLTTPMDEWRVKEICVDVLSGLQYLQSRNIVHRDIKPDNLLVSGDGSIKICDFGSAHRYSTDETRGPVDSKMSLLRVHGTPAYAAPELCGKKFGQGTRVRWFAEDMWSLGVTLYVLLFGYTPFRASRLDELYHSICEDELQLPSSSSVSKNCEKVLRGMLQKHPDRRATISQVAESAWLNDDGRLKDKVRRLKNAIPDGNGTTAPQAGRKRFWLRR